MAHFVQSINQERYLNLKPLFVFSTMQTDPLNRPLNLTCR
jgi:hypothetical protein